MEFQQYARGLSTISEEDFARILLRYTNLSEASVEEYLDRVRDRISQSQVLSLTRRLVVVAFPTKSTPETRLAILISYGYYAESVFDWL